MIRAITMALLLVAGFAAAQDAPPSTDDAALRAEEARLDAEEAAIAAEEARLDAAEQGLDPGAGSAADPAPVHPELRPVFEQFGGEAGLTAIMETFMAGLLADDRLGPVFAQSDHQRVKRQLVEQFCAILGGGCTYTGRDMRATHAGLGIDRADFNRLVELLQAAMEKHDVPFAAQNKLLAQLAPMHREVVTE